MRGGRQCACSSPSAKVAAVPVPSVRRGCPWAAQVVFGGFSAESLAGRMGDCKASVLLTCSAVRRGEKVMGLKEIADKAMDLAATRDGHRISACHSLPMILSLNHSHSS